MYSGLKFRLQGNDETQNRPRILMCAHPEEQNKLLEQNIEQIFDLRHDAVIWYAEPEELKLLEEAYEKSNSMAQSFDISKADEGLAALQSFSEDILNIQLIIVLVTARLLKENNLARDFLVDFAKSHNIQLMPLLIEDRMTYLANKTLGSQIQYLDKFAPYDPTTGSYEDKIKAFLDTIFMDNSKREQISSVFTKKAFISYRKKDRALADKVMRLVHEDSRLLTMGIWYDEYLCPGDRFNEIIRENIEKCDVMIFAVTKNVICGHNYVVDVEYPLARKLGKKMIFIDADGCCEDLSQKTDVVSNMEDVPKAEEIDFPIDKVKNFSLQEEIARELRSLLGISNVPVKRSPQDNYLLGLAYLRAINVEQDAEKAIMLLKESSEAGCVDAVNALSEVYSKGIGTAPDSELALKYLRSAFVGTKACAEKNNNSFWWEQFFMQAFELGDYYRDQGEAQKALEAYSEMIAIADRLMKLEGETDRIQRLLAVGCERCGDMLSDLEENEEDNKSLDVKNTPSILYGKMLERRNALYLKDGSKEHAEALCIALNKNGDYLLKKDSKAAKDYYLRCLEIASKVAKGEKSGQLRLMISVAHMGLANIEAKLGIKNHVHLDAMLKTAEELAIEEGEKENYDYLCKAYVTALNIYQYENNERAYTKTRDSYFAICDRLSRRPYEETALMNILNELIHLRRGIIIGIEDKLKVKGTGNEATKLKTDVIRQRKAIIEIISRLSFDEALPNLSMELEFQYSKLGDAYRTMRLDADAVNYYRKSVEMCKWMIKTGTEQEQRDFMREALINLENIGDVAFDQKNYAEALKYYIEDYSYAEQLIKLESTSASEWDYMNCCGKIAGIYNGYGDYEQVAFYLEKRASALERYAAITQTAAGYRDLFETCKRLGAAYELTEQQEKAIEAFQQAILAIQTAIDKEHRQVDIMGLKDFIKMLRNAGYDLKESE